MPGKMIVKPDFKNNVRQWAEWGVDFVKIDWTPITVEVTERIADSLNRCGRNIVLSLSNDTPPESAFRILSADYFLSLRYLIGET